jgi:excinuclease ABC subunit B
MEKQLCMLIKLPTVCKTIDETTYRRTKQINYNTANNLTPQALNKKDRKCLYKKPASRFRNSMTRCRTRKPVPI